MSDGPFQATPSDELRRQIMSSSVPKNEREHWASREIEWLAGKRNVLRTSLIKCFVHLGNEISRMTLNESAANGTQALSAEIAEILDLDNDRRVACGDKYLSVEKSSVKIDEGDRQMIILSLAKLTFTRPGWKYALREVAKSLHGEAMFDEFLKHGPDQKS